MLSSDHLHHTQYHSPRMRELKHLYWADGLGAIGNSMILILIPIYLLKIGYSFSDVLLFHMILFGGAIPMTYVGARLASRFAPNRLMAVASLGLSLFYLSMVALPAAPWLFWVAPLLRSCDKGIYWPSFHISFSKSRSHSKGDAQVGVLNALLIMAHGAVPAIGGLIASSLGIAVVYGIAIGFLVSSAAILIHSPDVTRHRPFNLRLLKWRIWRDLLANFSASGFYLVETIIWPLIIFLIIPTYAGVGVLSSVVVLSSAAVALYVGHRADQRGERHYLKEGSLAGSAINLLRAFVQTSTHVFGANLIGGLSHSLLATSMISRYYKHADKEPRLEYVFAMETIHLVGWTAILAVLFGLSLVLPVKTVLVLAVLLAVPMSFSTRLMR